MATAVDDVETVEEVKSKRPRIDTETLNIIHASADEARNAPPRYKDSSDLAEGLSVYEIFSDKVVGNDNGEDIMESKGFVWGRNGSDAMGRYLECRGFTVRNIDAGPRGRVKTPTEDMIRLWAMLKATGNKEMMAQARNTFADLFNDATMAKYFS